MNSRETTDWLGVDKRRKPIIRRVLYLPPEGERKSDLTGSDAVQENRDNNTRVRARADLQWVVQLFSRIAFCAQAVNGDDDGDGDGVCGDDDGDDVCDGGCGRNGADGDDADANRKLKSHVNFCRHDRGARDWRRTRVKSDASASTSVRSASASGCRATAGPIWARNALSVTSMCILINRWARGLKMSKGVFLHSYRSLVPSN